jgi:hypothetical protein
MRRTRCAIASIAMCAVIVGVGASAASAKVTLHFFAKQVYTRLSDAAGTPLPSNAPPVIGDRYSFGYNYFAGNHKHHAKRPSASAHVACTLTSTSSALCDGAIGLGGAMIIGDDFVLSFTASTITVKITGGTGRYRHAHGTVVSKNVGSNSDVTIKLS